MIVLETFGTIRADGTLELEQKLSPLPGRVKVRVESVEAESAEDLAKRFAHLVATWEHVSKDTGGNVPFSSADFPNLHSGNHKKSQPDVADELYNCIAWAAGDSARWWDRLSAPR